MAPTTVSAMTNPQIKAVVFDMGGVIVKLGPLEDVLAGAGLAPEEIWERWILSDAVRLHESGKCEVDEFATRLIAEFQVDLSPEEFMAQFVAFPQGLFDGAEDMVAAVTARGVTTGVLSNTNKMHWTEQIDHERIQALFNKQYLSYAMGLLKPDADIYEAVIADLGFAPAEILFIDDNQVNVDGATAVGMSGGLAKGPDEATKVLQEFGVLTSALGG